VGPLFHHSNAISEGSQAAPAHVESLMLQAWVLCVFLLFGLFSVFPLHFVES
jgi:hypothetical protein